MPVVFREDGMRFHFFSDEGDPREPVHIHIRRGRDNAKIWIHPAIGLAYNRGLSSHELNAVLRIVHRRAGEIERAWNEHFS